jgi:hypothetical protein
MYKFQLSVDVINIIILTAYIKKFILYLEHISFFHVNLVDFKISFHVNQNIYKNKHTYSLTLAGIKL